MSSVLVSVIIPARNEERYLAAALESVLAQGASFRFEVLVADSRSTDATAEVARRYGAMVVPAPLGIAEARNAGARAARGLYYLFLDADARLDERYLERAVALHHSGGCASFAGFFEFWPDRIWYRACTLLANWFLCLGSRLGLFWTTVPGFNYNVPADLFWQVGGFPPGFNEDAALTEALRPHARPGYVPDLRVRVSDRRLAQLGPWRTLHYYWLSGRGRPQVYQEVR